MSKSTPYTAREGSLAARVIAHLTEHGSSLNGPQIAQMFDVPPTGVANSLKPACEADALVRTKEGRSFTYSLPTAGARKARSTSSGAEAADTTPTKRRKRLAEVAAEHQLSVREQAAQLVDAAFWSDGDVVVRGVQVVEDGAAIVITREQLNALFILATQPHLAIPRAHQSGTVGSANEATFADVGGIAPH